MKSILNINIWREIKGSKGRFFSVMGLIALAVFVFVGLKATSPDMRNTVREAYQHQNLSDAKISMPSTAGFTTHDKKTLQAQSYVKKIEYGHQTDAKIQGQQTAIQLISKPDSLSKMTLMSGELPHNTNEIALGEQFKKHYQIGDTITLGDNHNHQLKALKQKQYRVTGFVRSAQYMKRQNLGSTNMATGQLNGFGVLTAPAFTGPANIAQVQYNNTKGVAYSDQYENQARHNTNQIQKVANQLAASHRDTLKQEANAGISQAQAKQKQIQAVALNAQGTPMAQKSQLALKQIKQKIDQLQTTKRQISQLTYTAQTRQSYSSGYSEFSSDAERVHKLSNTFPIFFFAVALMVSFVTMQRMADVKRTEVGTLRALGYSHMQAMREFIVYSILVASLGTILGATIGLIVLPDRIFEAFGSNFYTNPVSIHILWWPIIISFGLALLSTVFPAVYTTYYDMREQAATEMLPKPPANGKRILLERWTWLWSKLSFFNKVTFRNIFRYKVRMWMTILGVAGSIALLITGFGIRDSLNKIVPLQYQQLVHYDVTGITNPDASKHDRQAYQTTIDQDHNVARSTTVHLDNMNVHVKGLQDTQTVQLLVPKQANDFKQYLTLRDYQSKKPLHLKDNEAIITQKLAKIKGLKVGDTLLMDTPTGKAHRIKIGAIAEMYAGHTIVMNSNYYQKVFNQKATANAHLIRLKNQSTQAMQALSSKLNRENAAVTAIQSGTIRNDINTVLNSLNQVVLVIIIAAALLAFTVLYTLTNINVSERIKELSTLKVLGFYPKEVLEYIYRETSTLTLGGILLGFAFGYAVHAYLMSVVMPNDVMSTPGVTILNLLVSTLMIVLFAIIVLWLMARKINRVDMLEALK